MASDPTYPLDSHAGQPRVFVPPPETLRITEGAIHLWRLSLTPSEKLIPAMAAILSEEQRRWSQRFRFDALRRRFIAAHAGLRHILAIYTGQPPDQLAFSLGEHGKPYLEGHEEGKGLQFNLSHSGDWALIGVVLDRAIGVDIERIREVPEMKSVARTVFSAREIDHLNRCDESEHEAVFFRIWTRKEAIIKAIGTGLATPLKKFSVIATGPIDEAVFIVSRDPVQFQHWSGRNLLVIDGYDAAVAVEGEMLPVQCWQGTLPVPQ